MSLSFNGTDQYVLIADGPALALPEGDWSIAMRHLPSNPWSQTYRVLACWGAYGATPSFQWQFTTDRLVFKGRDNDGTAIPATGSTGTPGAASTWQSFVLVRSGDDFTQYVNGSVDGQCTVGEFGAVDVADDLYLAAYCTLSSACFLAGGLADVARWDRALSADEIGAIAAGAGALLFPSGLAWSLPLLASASPALGALGVTDLSGGASGHPQGLLVPSRPREVRPRPSMAGSVFRSSVFHSSILRGLGA